MIFTQIKNQLTFNPLFHSVTFIFILIMCFGLFETQASHYVHDVNDKSLGVWMFVTEIKQLIAALASINIPMLEGTLKEIVHSFNKMENLLMISALLANVQLFLIALSKISALKAAAFIVFVSTFIRKTSSKSGKILVLLLVLNPGLILYSAAVKQLADSANGYDNGLHAKLDNITKNLRKEKSQLMTQHQAQIKKIDKGHEDFKFFRRLGSDISYDVRDVADSLGGDIKEFRAIIRFGGKHLVKDAIEFIARSIFFMVLLPIGYVLLVYIVCRLLFKDFDPLLSNALEKLNSTIISKDVASAEKMIDIKNPASNAHNTATSMQAQDIEIRQRTVADNNVDSGTGTVVSDENSPTLEPDRPSVEKKPTIKI